MSDLQIVLIVIGGVIIAGVLIFNWWQERKFHRQVENNFSAFQHEAVETPTAPDAVGLANDVNPFDDQDFSISTDAFDDIDNRAEPDTEPTVLIEDTFTQPSIEQAPSSSDLSPSFIASELQQTSVEADTKSSKHNDIKAIIEEAFKQTPAANHAAAPELTAAEPAPIAAEAETLPAEPQAASLPAALHNQVDLVALLYLQGAATINDVLKSLKDGFDGYDKPSFVHVQTESEWLLLSDVASKPEFANQAISKICCSLQLADRAGPVTRSVLNRFQLAVESLGLDMNAHVEWQSTSDAANDAIALDQFCIEVDKTMGFHLLHGDNGAFTGTKLRGLAEAQGMALATDGSFKYIDEAAKNAASASADAAIPSFVMFNRDHNPFSIEMLRTSVVKSITFQLDIPHVKNCIEAFNQMVLVAKQMETGLNAQLVDDNNRVLSDAQIEKIRHQLKIIQATMLTRGIATGSDCAHRLFS